MKASAALRIQQKKIENAVFQAQKKAARELVQVLIETIKNRVRLLREDMDGNKFPDLSDKYIEKRKKFSSRLSKETSPDTSNATATGQMVDAMKGKASGSKIIIDLKSGRRKELDKSKSRLTNNEVNFWYQMNFGVWFGLQDKEKQEAIDYAAEIIEEEIKKVLK